MNQPKNIVDPDYVEPSIWSEWLAAFSRPYVLVHTAFELINSYVATRPWKRLLYFAPILIVVATALALVVWGRMISHEKLVMRYAVWAEAELARLKSEAGDVEQGQIALVDDVRTSPLSDMLYRRLLQLNDANARTRYLVAVQMARSQRIDEARNLMQEIAPLETGKSGYEPAHAWLAAEMLNRKVVSQAEVDRIQSHLSAIQNWEGISAGLLAFQAGFFEKSGKKAEAMEAMAKAAKKDPSMQAPYAMMARRLNMTRIADEMVVKARERLRELLKSPNAKLQHFTQLAALELSEGNLEDVLRVVREGLNRQLEGSDQLRLLSSEAYRVMYRKSLQKTPSGVQFDLTYLNQAMKEYPANPQVGTEIALLQNLGVEAGEELKKLLEQQLANGQASAVAHLLLAIEKIKDGRMTEAIPHLELTIKAAPNSPIALNNLALSLALTDSSQLPRAEELIDRAVALDPRNPELFDSQGQIRQMAARPLDAVESFEKAIGMDPNRISTRELIIKAYREAGLNDLATQQEQTIARLKAKKPE